MAAGGGSGNSGTCSGGRGSSGNGGNGSMEFTDFNDCVSHDDHVVHYHHVEEIYNKKFKPSAPGIRGGQGQQQLRVSEVLREVWHHFCRNTSGGDGEGKGGAHRLTIDELLDVGSVWYRYDAPSGIRRNNEFNKTKCKRLARSTLQNLTASTPTGSSLSYVRIHHSPRFYPTSSVKILEITPRYVVVYKPSNMPTHSTVDNSRDNLVNVVESMLREHASQHAGMLFTYGMKRA